MMGWSAGQMRASSPFPEDRDHLLFICAPIAQHPAEGLGQSKSSSSEYFLNNSDEQSNEEVGYPKEKNMVPPCSPKRLPFN